MRPFLTKGRESKDYGRAGRYVKQPAGYEAFIPAPLPPKPPVRISGKLQVLLSEATLALGRLDGSIHTLPNPDLFVLMYVRKEAVFRARSKELRAHFRTYSQQKQKSWTRPLRVT